MSAELWARDASGVNRKFRELWAQDGTGVNRKLKELWANDGTGVSRKIFSSGVPITLAEFVNSVQDSTNPSRYSVNADYFQLSGTVHWGGGYSSALMFLVFKLPAEFSHYATAAGINLVRFQGNVTYLGADSVNFFMDIVYSSDINTSPNPDYPGTVWHILDYRYVPTFSLDLTVASSQNMSGASNLYLRVGLIVNSSTISGPLTVPWSFTWLPTGEKLEYQP